MNSRIKRASSVAALLLAFAVSQVYLPVSLAELAANLGTPSPQATAVLSTGGNQPISVNGASAISGATILSGATIETPAGVRATVNFPGHFSLEIDGDSKLMLDFDGSSVKVTVIRGCVELDTRKGTSGQVVNETGQSLGKTDGSKDDDVDYCDMRTPGVAQVATTVGTAGDAGVTVGIIGAAAADAALIYFIVKGTRGDNPSPSSP
jgi:hypothetical protein